MRVLQVEGQDAIMDDVPSVYRPPSYLAAFLFDLGCTAPACRLVPPGAEHLVEGYIAKRGWSEEELQQAIRVMPTIAKACDFMSQSGSLSDELRVAFRDVLRLVVEVRIM